MRKTVTVPAAGEILVVSLTGLSLIIESANRYDTADDVPVLAFNSQGGNEFPIEPRATIQHKGDNGQGFGKIVITGTAASAGDEVTFISVDECLGTEYPREFRDVYNAVAGTTFQVTSTDAVQELSDVQITENGRLPSSMYISCTGANIAYAFNVDPTTGGFGHVLTAGADPVEIQGLNFIQNIRFCSAAAGTPGELIVTCEYS